MQLKWPMRWDLFSLFPAYAGVILNARKDKRMFNAFPRIRGGDPLFVFLFKNVLHFSPHTRG